MYDLCTYFDNSLATRASGPHSFPFRTRSLSPTAPMVLRPRGRGRVGRRRHLLMKPLITPRGQGLCRVHTRARTRHPYPTHVQPRAATLTHPPCLTSPRVHAPSPTPSADVPPPARDPRHPVPRESRQSRTHPRPVPVTPSRPRCRQSQLQADRTHRRDRETHPYQATRYRHHTPGRSSRSLHRVRARDRTAMISNRRSEIPREHAVALPSPVHWMRSGARRRHHTRARHRDVH